MTTQIWLKVFPGCSGDPDGGIGWAFIEATEHPDQEYGDWLAGMTFRDGKIILQVAGGMTVDIERLEDGDPVTVVEVPEQDLSIWEEALG